MFFLCFITSLPGAISIFCLFEQRVVQFFLFLGDSGVCSDILADSFTYFHNQTLIVFCTNIPETH